MGGVEESEVDRRDQGRRAGRRDEPVEQPANWFGVVTIALGIFIMITIEELPIGVLTLVSDDLGTSHGALGWAVTAPGLLAGVVSIATPLLIGRRDRRQWLVIAMALMVLGCIGSVLAPSFLVLLASRIPVGLSIGIFWCLAPPVGIRLVPARQRTLATTVIFSGASGALVLGVPLGSFLGATFGWRFAFGFVGGIGLVVGVLMWLLLGSMTADSAYRLSDLGEVLRRPAVATGVIVTTIVVVSQMSAYTFASPIVQQIAGIEVRLVSLMLLIYGIAGMVGNFAIGLVSSRSAATGVIIVAAGIAGVLAAYGFVATGPIGAGVMMIAWGLFGGAVGAALQTYIFHAAPDQVEIATALNTGPFNLSIALGALIGGLVLDAAGPHRLVLFAAAGLLLGAVVMVIGARRVAQDGPIRVG